MIKISEIVKTILYGDEVALYAISSGILNLSAYANTIKREVSARTKKPVKNSSIVVSLSRIAKTVKKQVPLLPLLKIDNISAKSGLVEITFDKNEHNRKLLNSLYAKPEFAQADFFTVTQGINEISIIVSEHLKKAVFAGFKEQKPKFFLDKLAGLTVSFGKEYITTPNTTYGFTRILAVRRINIVEVVSTYTEITFILAEKDLQLAFGLMSALFKGPAEDYNKIDIA